MIRKGKNGFQSFFNIQRRDLAAIGPRIVFAFSDMRSRLGP